MSMSSTGNATSPRPRRAKPKGETTVEVENKQDQSPDSADSRITQQEKTEKLKDMPVPSESTKESTKKDNTKLLVRQSSALTERPIGASNLEFAGTVTISGVRPIGVSTFEVVETIDAMGVRPIGANLIHVVDSINLSGIRPIASSGLVISDSYSVMGNRPVASNEVDDSPALMGFLD
ncbi:hypothetical protein [Calothrix sp. PCC 6303]|uniref:hypothetical protein n=1 Tax=Calothrix sp. PCC 6303 TaxID=1170562 RepID=UPI0002A01DC0|nr:hypothetical protein [Calothrix sp. PCC 6303]AFY99527.1 hypothetical protein Cal6303_0450 [Calothrix sp. PCC 6303]